MSHTAFKIYYKKRFMLEKGRIRVNDKIKPDVVVHAQGCLDYSVS